MNPWHGGVFRTLSNIWFTWFIYLIQYQVLILKVKHLSNIWFTLFNNLKHNIQKWNAQTYFKSSSSVIWKRREPIGYLQKFGYSKKPALSRLLRKLIKTISNLNNKQPKLKLFTWVQLQRLSQLHFFSNLKACLLCLQRIKHNLYWEMKFLRQTPYIRYVLVKLSKFVQIRILTSSDSFFTEDSLKTEKGLEIVSTPHFS